MKQRVAAPNLRELAWKTWKFSFDEWRGECSIKGSKVNPIPEKSDTSLPG